MSVVKLSDVVAVRSGYPFRTRISPDPRGNAFVLQMKDVNQRLPADVSGAIRAQVKAPETHQLAAGDVVLKARGNTHCAVVEETSRKLPLVAAAPLLALRPNLRKVNPAFLRWFLNHPSTQARLAAAAVGTYVPTVSKSSIEDLDIEVPSLQTQELIVRIAALADRERELLEAITLKRSDATDQLLWRLSRTSGDTRKRRGRRGAVTPRLPDHEQH